MAAEWRTDPKGRIEKMGEDGVELGGSHGGEPDG